MNKICTSLEQSKKLIELGIDVNTADMHYYKNSFGDYIEGLYNSSDLKEGCELKGIEYIPAWSLTALLNIIKPINENTYTIRGTLDGGAIISFDEITNIMFQEEEIIDTVFEMVVWLKESGKI